MVRGLSLIHHRMLSGYIYFGEHQPRLNIPHDSPHHHVQALHERNHGLPLVSGHGVSTVGQGR